MVTDHGQELRENPRMDEISLSKFKATCIAVLKSVQKTRKPVRITRFGEPLAEVVPATPEKPAKSWLGCMSRSIRITGDIVAPASDEPDWEVLR